MTRTSPRKVAKDLAKRLRAEEPDYQYLQAVFRHLRTELNVPVATKPKKLPNIPTEEELKRYYEVVWTERNSQDMLIAHSGETGRANRLKVADVEEHAVRVGTT